MSILLDVTASTREAVYKLISQQPGVEGTPEMIGAVSAQIQSIDGVPFERENQRGMARRYARTVSVSPAAGKPAFTDVLAGAWWGAGAHPAWHELVGGGIGGEAAEPPCWIDHRVDHAAANVCFDGGRHPQERIRAAYGAYRILFHARSARRATGHLLWRNPRAGRSRAGDPEGGL